MKCLVFSRRVVLVTVPFNFLQQQDPKAKGNITQCYLSASPYIGLPLKLNLEKYIMICFRSSVVYPHFRLYFVQFSFFHF